MSSIDPMFRVADPAPASEGRSDEILHSIRGVFADKGFDGASMQDLARAAGMSVGNFYRYFPSKAAIVEAIVTRDMAEVEQDFAAIFQSNQPLDGVRAKIADRIRGHACGDDGPLWAEITAAAMRKPEIAQVQQRMEDGIRYYLTAVFARATGLDPAEASRRFAAHATLIVMMVKATAMRKSGSDAAESDLTALVLRMIDNLLDDISNTKSEV